MPSRVYSWFTQIGHRDLIFDPTQSFFNSGLDFIKLNILTEFHEDWMDGWMFELFIDVQPQKGI